MNFEIIKISPSAYMLCTFNNWHARLCHVNKRLIKNMSNLSLILKLSLCNLDKYELLSQAKNTKSLNKLVDRVSEPFDLIHCDIYVSLKERLMENDILSLSFMIVLISLMCIL